MEHLKTRFNDLKVSWSCIILRYVAYLCVVGDIEADVLTVADVTASNVRLCPGPRHTDRSTH